MEDVKTYDFIKRSLNIHNNKYDYSKTKYINNHTKVIIICSKHGEFLQRPHHHLSGHGCRECANEKTSKIFRSSKAEFIKKAKKIHNNKYNYSKTKYVNAKTKIIITCPEHGDFLQTPSTHLTSGCPKCGRNKVKRNIKNFIENCKEIHNNRYDYSKTKYVNSYTKIIIICSKHGEFLQIPANHLQGHGCSKCADENQRKTIKNFIENCKEIHNNKYDYSKTKYVNSHIKIIIICPKHGEFLQYPNNHLNGSGCPECANEDQRKTIKEFIKRAREVHNNKYNYSKVKYINNHTKVIIICPKHGEFSQTPNSHLNGSGCPFCSSSISKISQLWLDSLNIPKKFREKVIKVGKTKYIVDALYENTVYEFNGDFWHGNPKIFNSKDINPITNITFGELYNKTIRKEKELKDAGYVVVSVWESELIKDKKWNS